jgi:hypothetical protein
MDTGTDMSNEPIKPLIQIDDLVREMTDEEHQQYLEQQANAPAQLDTGTDGN